MARDALHTVVMSATARSGASDAMTTGAIAIVSRWVVGVAVVLAIGALVLDGPARALGVAGGGLLASVTWLGSALCATRLAAAEGGARLGWSLAFTIVCSLAVGGAVLLLVLTDGGSAAIGFGALVIGVIGGAIESWARLDR